MLLLSRQRLAAVGLPVPASPPAALHHCRHLVTAIAAVSRTICTPHRIPFYHSDRHRSRHRLLPVAASWLPRPPPLHATAALSFTDKRAASASASSASSSSSAPGSPSPPSSSPPGVLPSFDKKEGTAPLQSTQASAVPKPGDDVEPQPPCPIPLSAHHTHTTHASPSAFPSPSSPPAQSPKTAQPIIRSPTASSVPSKSRSSAAGAAPANRYDLVVVGSGPAGQKCAINAAKLKKRVAIVDKREMYGGVCIHTGTIPSKTFREAVLYLTGYRQRGFYGKGFIRRDEFSSVDILDRVQKVEQWETQTILDQLQRNRVVCIQGTARFLDANSIEITGEKGGDGVVVGQEKATSRAGEDSNTHVVHAEHTLICCGTRPARNDLYPFSSSLVFDADQILQRETWDSVRHLIVIGGGVIAMEYASMFNALPGCRVTIVDERPTVLDFIDSEVVQTLRHIMGRSGATFRLGEKVVKVEANDATSTVRVTLESGKTVIGDALFYAVGRQANTDSLQLEAAGVHTAKRGLIPVNEFFQTNVSHIYAAGDVIGFPALASTAMEQGRLASSHMFGQGRPMKPVFPYGIYTIPEISVIGASEQELTRAKQPYEVGIAKFEETAKGQMIGGQHIDGFLKLLFDPSTRRLLGCAAIGESAVEIIHIGQSVMSLGGTIEYFRDSVFNYPTMAETYRVAALDGLGRLGMSS